MLQHILRSSAKFSKNSLLQAEQEAGIVANISLNFDETRISSLLISASETEKTKISDSPFGARHIVGEIHLDNLYSLILRKLVDEKSARTQLPSEILVPVRKDHRDICSVDVSSELYKHIVRLLQTVVQSQLIDTPLVDQANGEIPLLAPPSY